MISSLFPLDHFTLKGSNVYATLIRKWKQENLEKKEIPAYEILKLKGSTADEEYDATEVRIAPVER